MVPGTGLATKQEQFACLSLDGLIALSYRQTPEIETANSQAFVAGDLPLLPAGS